MIREVDTKGLSKEDKELNDIIYNIMRALIPEDKIDIIRVHIGKDDRGIMRHLSDSNGDVMNDYTSNLFRQNNYTALSNHINEVLIPEIFKCTARYNKEA